MSKWLPDVNELFYVKCLLTYQKEILDKDCNVISVVTAQDRSYCDNIFRMVANDSKVIVADIVYGSTICDKRHVFLRNEWDVMPVGPDVVIALGLQEE